MSVSQWAGIVSSIIGILAAFWSMHRYLTRSMIRDYLSELRPNGGSSVKDKVDSIDRQVNKLESRVDEIYRLLLSRP